MTKLTEKDLKDLDVIGEYFWKQSPYATTGMEYNPDAVKGLLELLSEEHYLDVIYKEDTIVGVIGILVSPMHFNPEYTMANEVFFFIHPELRSTGLGQKMLDKAEKSVKEMGVDVLTMGEMRSSKDMTDFYEQAGYVLTERSFSKVI